MGFPLETKKQRSVSMWGNEPMNSKFSKFSLGSVSLSVSCQKLHFPRAWLSWPLEASRHGSGRGRGTLLTASWAKVASWVHWVTSSGWFASASGPTAPPDTSGKKEGQIYACDRFPTPFRENSHVVLKPIDSGRIRPNLGDDSAFNAQPIALYSRSTLNAERKQDVISINVYLGNQASEAKLMQASTK